MNTPNNFLIKSGLLTSTISTNETIFTGFNIVLVIIIVVVVTALMTLMHPPKGKAYKVKPELLDKLKLYEGPERPSEITTASTWMNWWPGFNIIVAAAGLIWLGMEVQAKGFANSINLNNINLFFLMLGVLFHWRPWSFLKATEDTRQKRSGESSFSSHSMPGSSVCSNIRLSPLP